MSSLVSTPQICLSLGRLLHHLAHSPLGSVTLLDFRPRQFVLVDGELKVTDLDDARVEETPCASSADCILEFPARNFTLPCSAQGWCEGMNEKRNLYNAYRWPPPPTQEGQGGGVGPGGHGEGGANMGSRRPAGVGRLCLDQWNSRGGESLPPTQEGNIQAPDDEAKNSQLQGESGVEGGSWRLLKIVSDSEPRAGGTGTTHSSPGPSPLEAPHWAPAMGLF